MMILYRDEVEFYQDLSLSIPIKLELTYIIRISIYDYTSTMFL